MKKSQMKRKILKKILEWDGSQPEMGMASEILEVIMGNGMRLTKDVWPYLNPIAIDFEPETRRKSKRK